MTDTTDALPPPSERRHFEAHDWPEHTIDLGEVTMNYAVAGSPDKPALLLIPGQSESWWGYEKAMAILAADFHVHAVDLRGQGRSTWTPRRYTLDNMGNDLIKFIALAIKRPVITSGCSSGGVLSAWLAAFAMPGQIRGACLEDPPLFASETRPLYGHSIRQGAGPIFALWAKHLGDQWSIGDWKGLNAAQAADPFPVNRMMASIETPPQRMREYDPEWGRAFTEGTVAASCPHERMLAQVKTPILFTHHMRMIDPATGNLMGAVSDLQAAKVGEIVREAGQDFTYVDAQGAAHAMHEADPPRFAKILGEWAKALPA